MAAGWLVDELVKEFDLWLVHVATAGMRENFSLIFKINFQPLVFLVGQWLQHRRKLQNSHQRCYLSIAVNFF